MKKKLIKRCIQLKLYKIPAFMSQVHDNSIENNGIQPESDYKYNDK